MSVQDAMKKISNKLKMQNKKLMLHNPIKEQDKYTGCF